MPNSILRTQEQAISASSFISKVYLWMFFGLGLTFLVSYAVSINKQITMAIAANPILFWVLVIGELGLVFTISAGINKLNAQVAAFLFILYSLLNGVTLSFIFLAYTQTVIASAFGTSALMFLIMSLFGLTTKKDLTGFGHFLFMGLIGVIIASVVNIFLKSPMMYFVISVIGVIVFAGLAAYDNQKLKQMSYSIDVEDSSGVLKGSVIGALALYLDFINLFLMLLNLFGMGKRE
ncbi:MULTISPECIES: Bax inhibitor-1/YccA family protein [Desulfurella]|jgi:FtsH-binding integral membrane protein|uniref:Bax inhibitor-1/YccA family protein n=1 Tax=Desulfurella TaxID=33001 RepID=UPI0003E09420|nr:MULTISPECIES: Bax inhibitor-1/YccA family protein [Desulfurella]AHF96976.1 membrane protein [Desulfurella acetivorans A63]PMP66868.1 MAG: BAX inhibitor (BI)-1/YccA family protein [Desulfurella multipotens]PMP87620.1 MAG: BAX inhibitor (BI)-1/YccA family protein [Desulfurella sp.]HEX13329.1 Bax inhibitor-1/YccA family protein [Desulfurella acetivorans]